MHDILEGTLPLVTKLLLQHFIHERRLFTLDQLNSRIASFKYGSAVKNKPSTITTSSFNSTDAKLRQSGMPENTKFNKFIIIIVLASQMWCLARLLPLMIGDLVPTDDDIWENYLTLLDIVDYALAPRTTKEKAAYLAVLVEDFLSEFSRLYDRPLIPKMHYMVHLATWMLL